MICAREADRGRRHVASSCDIDLGASNVELRSWISLCNVKSDSFNPLIIAASVSRTIIKWTSSIPEEVVAWGNVRGNLEAIDTVGEWGAPTSISV